MISASEDNLSVSMARKKVFQSERCCLSAQNNVLDIAGEIAVCSNSWIHSERNGGKKETHAPFAFYYFGWHFLESSACCSDFETDVLSIINGQIVEVFFFSLLLLIFLHNQNFKSDYYIRIFRGFFTGLQSFSLMIQHALRAAPKTRTTNVAGSSAADFYPRTAPDGCVFQYGCAACLLRPAASDNNTGCVLSAAQCRTAAARPARPHSD